MAIPVERRKQLIMLQRIASICLSLLTTFLIGGITHGVALANHSSFMDVHNRFILNGEPFFPLGLYVVQCTNGDYAAQLQEIADSPFDTLMNYAITGCDADATNDQIIAYLYQLQKRNLMLIFSLSSYFGPCNPGNTKCHNLRVRADIINNITQKVTAFREHPAIITWYINDEVCPACLPELEAGYQKLRELDENHPVWSVHWNTNWLIQEAHTTDIVGVDPYPIDNSAITLVSRMADAANKAGKPLWLVPQIFSWTDYPGDFRAKTGRPPMRDEMRSMTYLAINHGAKGLIYYSYFNIRDDKDYEDRWRQVKEIAGEVKNLRPVILSTYKTDKNDIVCDNRSIDFKLMRKDDTYYLMAVNTKKTSITDVSLKIKLVRTPRIIRVLFEDNREIPVRDGNFTDDFGPYGVHVYHWNSASPSD